MSDPLQPAIEHHRAGRLAEAEAIYRRMLPRSPGDPRLLHLLGTLLLQRKQFADAISFLRGALAIAPNAPQSWFSLAQALRFTRQLTDAEAAIRRSVALRPQFPQGYNELGLTLVDQGMLEPAMAAWRQAVELKSDYGEALCNLGAGYAQLDQFTEALETLKRVVQLMPTYAPAHNNLANVFDELGRTDEAIPHWWRAVKLNPHFFDALINLGKTLHQRGDYADSESLIQRALELQPSDPHARFLRGMQQLLRGELREGFANYEYRFQSPNFDLAARKFPQPRWDGGDIAGKTILLHAEQGLGDTIQFARYAPLLAERGAKVVIESPIELKELLQTLPNVSAVVTRGETLPAFDMHASVVTLPMLFGTTLDTIPRNVPYLRADAQKAAQWAEMLARVPAGRRVGVVWSGNPKHKNDRNRSIPLRELAALAGVADTKFYSLQKGPAAGQIAWVPLGFELIDHTSELNTFADTAALIGNLDVVLTVDTAVARLAGALGKPVWLLLAHVPDWRWMLDRSDSQWYPTAKLFRQPMPGDWSSVMQAVVAELRR